MAAFTVIIVGALSPGYDVTTRTVSRLAVPGMPAGSPGMAAPGQSGESYQILAFEKSGRYSVYARR